MSVRSNESALKYKEELKMLLFQKHAKSKRLKIEQDLV